MGDRLATIDVGQKVGEADAPLSVGEGAGSPSNTMLPGEAYLRTKWHTDPSNRLATIHQRYSQTGHTDRTDNGPIA